MNEYFKNHKTQELKLFLFILGFYCFSKAKALRISEIQNLQVYPERLTTHSLNLSTIFL